MRRPSGQQGFTLIEIVIVLAISGILLSVVMAIPASLLSAPIREHAEITAMHDLQELNFWLIQDGNAAISFKSGSSPEYGTFSGYEYATGSSVAIQVRYFYQAHRVIREVTNNAVVSATNMVANNIQRYEDISFQYTPAAWTYDPFTRVWSVTEAKVQVMAKSTVPALDVPAGHPDAIFSATIEVHLRPQTQRDVAVPGNPPTVPPLAYQFDFYVSGEPTINLGTYVSGSGANLRSADSIFYTVSGAGVPVTLEWVATSQPIPYTSISDISIKFAGQADQAYTALSIYVFNPSDPTHINAGYDTTPDAEDQYAVANVDQTVTFPLSDSDVAYINSLPTKVITVKVDASLNKNFRLRADQLVFTVAGTPQPGFSLDYYVDTTQGVTIDTGTYQSGSASDLVAADSVYYQVKSVNVSWP